MNLERAINQVRRCDLVIDNFGGKISDFIPTHHTIYGKNAKGEECVFIIMKKVEGENISEMTSLPAEARIQLEELVTLSMDMYEKSLTHNDFKAGEIIDLIPVTHGHSGELGNIMWGSVDGGEKRLYMVDTYPIREYSAPAELNGYLNLALRILETKTKTKFSPGFIHKMENRCEALQKEQSSR
jgi:hypothetical protein